MCHVQRVINTCGHRNDHVSLCCHFAKAGYQLVVPISDPNSNLSCPNTNATNTTTASTADGHSSSSSHNQDTNDGGNTAAAVVEKRGFHAYSGPYCVYASVRTLDSPMGFMCMVGGCGRAD